MDSLSNHRYSENKSIITILIIIVIYVISIVIAWQLLNWSLQKVSTYARLGGVLATVALATGIYYQSILSAESLNEAKRNNLIQQESEWLPEVRHVLNSNWLLFSGSRPWYPWFKVELDGESSGWVEGSVRVFSQKESIDEGNGCRTDKSPDDRERHSHQEKLLGSDHVGIDWYITFPKKSADFLEM